MNLKHLNLDLHGVPGDTRIQTSVFLISEDLKARKLINGLIGIGCEACFCTGEFCDLVIAYVGFDDPPNDLYDLYFGLLDRFCENVSRANGRPIKEALEIYRILRAEKDKRSINVIKSRRDSKTFLRAVGNKFHSLRNDKSEELDTVAKVVRISPAILVRIERGDYDMHQDLLSDLCDYYNISLSNFFADVEGNLVNPARV